MRHHKPKFWLPKKFHNHIQFKIQNAVHFPERRITTTERGHLKWTRLRLLNMQRNSLVSCIIMQKNFCFSDEWAFCLRCCFLDTNCAAIMGGNNFWRNINLFHIRWAMLIKINTALYRLNFKNTRLSLSVVYWLINVMRSHKKG